MSKSLLVSLISTLSFLSFSAFGACPEIEGVYTCTVNGTSSEMVVNQELQNGVMVYFIDSNDLKLEVKTDGRRYNVDSPVATLRNPSYVSRCQNQRVKIDIKADVQSGRLTLAATMNLLFFQRADGQLESRSTITVAGYNQPSVTTLCQKL
jgi:hypothetical protein